MKFEEYNTDEKIIGITIFIFIFLIFLFFIFAQVYEKYKTPVNPEILPEQNNLPKDNFSEIEIVKIPDFIPSPTFTGSHKGYVFKRDYAGLGYYIDNPKPVDYELLDNLLFG